MKTERIVCDCGHIESEHSDFTRGYSTDEEGKTHCYECSLKLDIEHLKVNKKLIGYISCDGKEVVTWPGLKIAKITASHVVNFGYCRNQISFDAMTDDGLKLYGRGPGNGMYCSIRVRK